MANRAQTDDLLADIRETLVQAMAGAPKKERDRIADAFHDRGFAEMQATSSNSTRAFGNVRAQVFLGFHKALRTWSPPVIPRTCVEAADRLTAASFDAYLPEAKELRRVADTLRAFGDAPLPDTIRDSYRWDHLA